eukprot:6214498-Pleurochrysis_carterae.AAC.5
MLSHPFIFTSILLKCEALGHAHDIYASAHLSTTACGVHIFSFAVPSVKNPETPPDQNLNYRSLIRSIP